MAFYYKIENPGKKTETIANFKSDLELFLAQQQRSVYRSATYNIDILYDKITGSPSQRIEIVSGSSIPLEFICNWGKLIEEPRQVSKAKHFFMARTKMNQIPTTERCCEVLQEVIGEYSPEIKLFPLENLLKFNSFNSNFPNIPINVLSDGVFVGYTVGEITEMVRFYEHFSKRAKETKLINFYLSAEKGNTLGFE